jgi:hypothetical protein
MYHLTDDIIEVETNVSHVPGFTFCKPFFCDFTYYINIDFHLLLLDLINNRDAMLYKVSNYVSESAADMHTDVFIKFFIWYLGKHAEHSGRAVWSMNCVRWLERWDRGFESHSRHGCLCLRLICVCVVLYVGSDLAAGWSPVQGVLPAVYRIKKLKTRPRPNKRTIDRYIDR